ncbi:hypothetical protein THRCLA_10590, partial [Thraustotheca clavata]
MPYDKLYDCTILFEAKLDIKNEGHGKVTKYLNFYNTSGYAYAVLFDRTSFWLFTSYRRIVTNIVQAKWIDCGSKDLLRNFILSSIAPWVQILNHALRLFEVEIIEGQPFLGSGACGRVFRVCKGENVFALKIVNREFSTYLIRESTILDSNRNTGLTVDLVSGYEELPGGGAILLHPVGEPLPKPTTRPKVKILFEHLWQLHEKNIAHGDPRVPNVVIHDDSMMNDGVIEFSCPQSLEAAPGSSGLSDTGLELDVSSLVLAPAPSFRFKELAKDTNLNLSPTAKQRQVHADYLNQMQAMQPIREPQQQMSLRFHQGRVELAGCGYEYGLPEYRTMPPTHTPMPAGQGTTPTPSQGSDGNDEPVHFLGPAENIKTLFKLPYSRNRVSLAIHRVGNTLVVDGDVDEKDLPKGFDECNEVLRIGHSAQFNTQPLLEQEETQPNAELYENFIYQSTHLAISPPASTEKDKFAEAVVEQKVKAPKVKLSAKEKKRRAKLKRQMAAKTSASYDTSSLPNVVPSFQGILKWKFQDMQMILGSDVQLFSNKEHPAVSLKLHDADQDLSLCTVLDYYLDNVIANIPELAICMHSKGHVRGYQLVQTRDIPYLNGSTKPLFDIRDVNMNATMLFKFLQHNCSEPNGTYWLYRAEGDYSLRLYDVRMLSKGKQRKWKYMMAMLCYRFASRAARLISSAFEAPSLQNRLRHRQRELLSTCLDLLEELRQDQTGSRAQDSISASVAEQMADTYLRELDDKMSCSDKISRLRQAKQHLQHSIRVSENCVKDYCVELEHKQQMKQAANTNSLPVSESLALSPSLAPSPGSTTEWTDEEYDDEDEEDDMRLFMEEEVVRLQLKHSSANLHLAALYMETKAFADMLRSLHDACMYIRISDLPPVSPISFDSIDSVVFFHSIVSELDFGGAPMKSASKMSVKQCYSMEEVRACVLETIGDLASSRSLGMPDMSFVRAVVLTFSILTGGTKLKGTYLHEVFSAFPVLLSKFTMDLGQNLEESCLYLAFFAYLRALSPPVNAELYFVLMKKLGNAANEFGKFYLRYQEHNKAYLWFEGGSVIFEAIEDGSNAALLCANLSNLHKVLAEKCSRISEQDAHYTKSVALCQKAHSLLKQSKATNELHAKVTGELALTYLVWAVREGSRSSGSADYEATVVEKFNKALNMYIELGDARQVASTHYQMASFYNRLILSKSPSDLQGVAIKPRMELTRRHYEKALQYFSTMLGKT